MSLLHPDIETGSHEDEKIPRFSSVVLCTFFLPAQTSHGDARRGGLWTAACTQNPPDEASTYNGKTPSATVEFKQIQVAYLGSGSTGNGVLTYQGQSYPFSISGLGVGGIGASSIAATGVVYNLTNLT